MRIEFGDERLPQRFWDKVQVAESGCWEWTASGTTKGYGQFYWDGRVRLAHRVAYETLVGEIQIDLESDHLCRNRGCVNPLHLEPVTRQENTIRGMSSTHARGAEFCRKGLHRLTPDNVYEYASGQRYCRACHDESNRIYRETHRRQINQRDRERYWLAKENRV